MSRLATDVELDAAIRGVTAGPGARLVDQLADSHRRAPASDIRLTPAVTTALLGELELARLTAAKLGMEVLAHRRNIKLHEGEPPSKLRECDNCLHYSAVLSNDAQAAPSMQAISKDPGVCTANPPSVQQRGNPPHLTTSSIFPPVHPRWRCGRWEKLTTPGLKVPGE